MGADGDGHSMDEERIAVCASIRQLPATDLPSCVRTCLQCGAAVWLSLALAPYVDDCICIDCAAVWTAPGQRVEVHAATLQELRDYGLSEAEIERMETRVRARLEKRPT
jgi:hypothetical protein